MKMYRLVLGSNLIEEHEIVKITNSSVTRISKWRTKVNERKISNFVSWHETPDQAIEAFQKQLEMEILALKNRMEYKQAALNDFLVKYSDHNNITKS